jgi:hypothetical protein
MCNAEVPAASQACEVISSQEVCALLGISLRTLYRIAHLIGRRVHRHWYFSRQRVLAYMTTPEAIRNAAS